jgi:hypothetical protein
LAALPILAPHLRGRRDGRPRRQCGAPVWIHQGVVRFISGHLGRTIWFDQPRATIALFWTLAYHSTLHARCLIHLHGRRSFNTTLWQSHGGKGDFPRLTVCGFRNRDSIVDSPSRGHRPRFEEANRLVVCRLPRRTSRNLSPRESRVILHVLVLAKDGQLCPARNASKQLGDVNAHHFTRPCHRILRFSVTDFQFGSKFNRPDRRTRHKWGCT